MPYVSKNYRHTPKPRLQSLREAGTFLGFSILAVMLLIFIIGWIAYAAQSF